MHRRSFLQGLVGALGAIALGKSLPPGVTKVRRYDSSPSAAPLTPKGDYVIGLRNSRDELVAQTDWNASEDVVFFPTADSSWGTITHAAIYHPHTGAVWVIDIDAPKVVLPSDTVTLKMDFPLLS